MLTEMFDKSILIFGCGNILFGDDGFGPAVVDYLQANYTLPPDVLALNVGTSIRDILFNLTLHEKKPQKIFIVDAVDYPDRQPGEVFDIKVDGIPAQKISDFSLHQFPTVNILQELQDHTQIAIKIFVVQVESIPEQVNPGLSSPVQKAIAVTCERLMQNIKG